MGWGIWWSGLSFLLVFGRACPLDTVGEGDHMTTYVHSAREKSSLEYVLRPRYAPFGSLIVYT